ncbi:MAG: NADP-dependent oxidoreductase domain-containing protein [Monoraphidium minutum]|nr:MAG: NADP-dependent oxidoreductase domain-containing protein [Monoraphidium minutum]
MMLRSRAFASGGRHTAAAQRRAVAAAAVAERATLGTGAGALQFAPIINGCWQLAGGHGREVFDGIEAKLAAHAAAGFTTFDTADIYGPSERILGEFQASWAAQGNPPVQVLTKYVPNVFQQRVTPAGVEAAMQKSLGALRVQQLDLVQMHWWDYAIPGMVDAALALADCQAKGLIKQVGVTNMDTEALSKIVDAGVPVASNQVQFSLLDRRPLNGMLQYCEPRGIKVLAYGSVGGGLLSDKYVEQPRKSLLGGAKFSNVDLNTSSLKMYWGTAKRFGGQELWRRLLLVLRGVADKHNCSVANVAVRWVMQQGSGVHPIIGLRGVDHIADNEAALALTLDAADLAAIAEVLSEAQGPAGDVYSFERAG